MCVSVFFLYIVCSIPFCIFKSDMPKIFCSIQYTYKRISVQRYILYVYNIFLFLSIQSRPLWCTPRQDMGLGSKVVSFQDGETWYQQCVGFRECKFNWVDGTDTVYWVAPPCNSDYQEAFICLMGYLLNLQVFGHFYLSHPYLCLRHVFRKIIGDIPTSTNSQWSPRLSSHSCKKCPSF